MSSRKNLGWISLVLFGLGLYQFRRQLIGKLLGLGPARRRVQVRRGLKIPMPDGDILVADHYAPRDQRLFPTILIRTPYGRGGGSGPPGLVNGFIAQRFAERGYNVLVQDVRGRFDSTGQFEPFVHEKQDGMATMRWIESQPWFNGVLGMWGPSYLGYVQWAVADDAPLYLKAIMPVLSGSRLPLIGVRDRAFALDMTLRWLLTLYLLEDARGLRGLLKLGKISPAAQDRLIERCVRHLPLSQADRLAVGKRIPFYQAWLEHADPDDPYWKESGQLPEIGSLRAAAHLVGGWYDILLRETLEDYTRLRASGCQPYLTIGPWAHLDIDCWWESLRQGIAWFDAHLKGDRRALNEKPVRLYLMGGGGWRSLPDWPPKNSQHSYFLAGPAIPGKRRSGLLSEAEPAVDAPPSAYVYDPAQPTPALGGPMMNLHAGRRDQRSLENRPDVLCFTTAPFEHPLVVMGAARLVLYLHSSRDFTDFVARLCDVAPDGRSYNVCDGILRLEPGVGQSQPDGSQCVQIDLWPTAYQFAAGHAIRLQVSSGAYPRWSRNLGGGEPLATATSLYPAQQTIYHDRLHPSRLILPLAVD